MVAVEDDDGYEAARREARTTEDHFRDVVIPSRVEAVLEEMNETLAPILGGARFVFVRREQ
jgi:hypothetical protein